MTTNKTSLIKFFHEMLNSNSEVDMDTTMVAIEAVMAAHNITWDSTDFIVDDEIASIRDYFVSEVNTVAMAKNFQRFYELCMFCMYFGFYTTCASKQPADFANPY